MGKNKNCLVAFYLVFVLFSFTLQGALVPVNECLQQTFINEIGVRETGTNSGVEVDQYLNSAGLMSGYAWCAAFVYWCHVQCIIVDLPLFGAWSPSWFVERKLIYKRGSEHNLIPRIGDVFGIYFQSKKRIAHVGFVEDWGDDWVTTVEGNTNEAGSREGDGVYRKKRLKRQIYAVARWN